MIEIDGGILEGGGQILRVALSMSCLLRRPVHIFNIRAGRPKPGLAAQHLKCVELLKEICDANVQGADFGSTDIRFTPSTIKHGKFYADTKTAGSVALLMQAALPVLLFSDNTSVLDLRGGTNAAKAPQIDFMTEIFRPNLEKFGATFNFELHKRGFFPQGGGHCELIVEPIKKLNPINLTEFGLIKKFFGRCFVAGSLPISIAHDMKGGAMDAFRPVVSNVPIHITAYKESKEIARHKCAGIIVGCETLTGCVVGASALVSPHDTAFFIGAQAGEEVVNCINNDSCIDPFVQDQIMIFMALADGVSRIKTLTTTLHTETAIYVIEQMCEAKFRIISLSDKTCMIECQGIGYFNSAL